MATFMADYELFQIEITKNYTTVEWRDDLKRVQYCMSLFQEFITLYMYIIFTDENVFVHILVCVCVCVRVRVCVCVCV